MKRYGKTYPEKNKEGKVVGFRVFPEVKMLATVREQLKSLMTELGLTPSGRTRIRVANDTKSSRVATRQRTLPMRAG